MKTTKAYMRTILRKLLKMQIADGFERDFEVKSYYMDGITVVQATFIYPAIKPTKKRKWDVYYFTFYDFWDKETNDKILTEIQDHINGHSKTK